jgi:D-3-phosphoglycerate dehydrogenase / 2-oxoglutarate reductase
LIVASFRVALAALDAPEVPGWVVEQLKSQGIELAVHDCLNAADFLQYARDADLVWVFGGNKFVSAESLRPLLPQLSRCGAILRTGSGTDNVPVDAATELGIIVANTPEAISDNVADHAIGLLFAITRQIALQARLVREGVWDRRRGWPNWHLAGQTLGLVGFGHIGQLVAAKMRGFDLKILAYDPVVSEDVLRLFGVHPSTLDDLLRQSDFVLLHCPLTKATYHLIGERELQLMRKHAVLINTSRGSVIDEKALVRGLTEGWIAAAGLDVLETEPPPPDHPLLSRSNAVITPHIGGYSDCSTENFWKHSVQVILDFAARRWPRWIVNREVEPRWALQK